MDREQLLKQGMAAVKAGQRVEARRLLEQVVRADPQSEQGWLWLSGAVDTPEERRFCLAQVLATNPDNTAARQGLEKLGSEPARSPLPDAEGPLVMIEERPSAISEEAPPAVEEEALPQSAEAPTAAVSLEEKERVEPAEETLAPPPADEASFPPDRTEAATPAPEIEDVPLPEWDQVTPVQTALEEEEIPLPDWGQEVPVEGVSQETSLAEGEEEAPAAGVVAERWPVGEESTAAEKVICPRCGADNPPESQVCQRCGAFIHRSPAPTRAPIAQPTPLPAEEGFPAAPGDQFVQQEQTTAATRIRTNPILIAVAVILLVACLTLACIAGLSLWQVPGAGP